jgi:Tol biopolymer transport system component
MKLDSSKTVERFAHMRTSGATYDTQAKGVFSPDGSKVMFNSDWGSGTVYAYVAEVPGNSGNTVPPPAPTALRLTGISQTEIDPSWNASTDILGVTNILTSLR